MPLWKKLAGLLAVLYFLAPVDAIPDFIPVVGWLDDVGVLTAAALWMMRQVRNYHPESRPDGIPRDREGRARLPPVHDSLSSR